MIICSGRIYEYLGVTFEYNRRACGWWPLKKDGSPYERLTGKVRSTWVDWQLLPQWEKLKYAKGGGCERL